MNKETNPVRTPEDMIENLSIREIDKKTWEIRHEGVTLVTLHSFEELIYMMRGIEGLVKGLSLVRRAVRFEEGVAR